MPDCLRFLARRPAAHLPLLLLTALLAVSCGDDGNPLQPTTGAISGVVTDINTGAPVTDATLLVVADSTLVPVAKPVGTDAQGRYLVEQLPPGEYAVFVYHCRKVVFDRTGSRIRVEAGKAATHNMRLITAGLWDCAGYRVEGTVLDSATNLPLAGAFVGGEWWATQDTPYLFRGIGVPDWDATDAAGHFAVNVSTFTGPGSPGPQGLEPITITRQGYQPTTLVGPDGIMLPLPPGTDTVLTVTVRLRPVPASGASLGALRGRIVWLDRPVAGIAVALSAGWTDRGDTLRIESTPLTPVPERTAVTDAAGEFLIPGITPGHYALAPAYRDDDGYLFEDPRPIEIGLYHVPAGDTLDVGDVPVNKALLPLSPAVGAVNQSRTPEFRWQAPDLPAGFFVHDYTLQYGEEYFTLAEQAGITETHWTLPESAALNPGAHVRWHVQAWAVLEGVPAVRFYLGDMETMATFTVASQ